MAAEGTPIEPRWVGTADRFSRRMASAATACSSSPDASISRRLRTCSCPQIIRASCGRIQLTDRHSNAKTRSSRESAEAAGFHPGTPGSWAERLSERVLRTSGFFWASRQSLFEVVNDVLHKIASDDRIVADERARWVHRQKRFGHVGGDFAITPKDELPAEWSFLLVGDTGEGDGSQYAVADVMAHHDDTEFMVIVSDVVYPAGDVNDYVDCFYIPYQAYPSRIYGVPGNHDWYDLLSGFMFHFCDAEPLAPTSFRLGRYDWRERIARVHWVPSSPPRRALLQAYQERRAESLRWPKQPGPYYVIDTDELRIVCIDTGTAGVLDRQQAKWLISVSGDPRPKIMLLGNPLVVDGAHRPCPIQWIHSATAGYTDVASIVREPEFFYIAVVGGDVHNYQRYPARRTIPTEPARRDVQFIVAGGGGAFLSPTHRIPRVSLNVEGFAPIEEESFRCFPLRGDSLARFSQMLGVRLTATFLACVVGLLVVVAGAAAVVLTPDWGPATASAIVTLVLALSAIGLFRWDGLRPLVRAELSAPLLFFAILVWATHPDWLPEALTIGVLTLLGLLGTVLFFAIVFMAVIGRSVLFRHTGIEPDDAARVVGDRLEIEPTREAAARAQPSKQTRARVRSLHPIGPSRKLIGPLFSDIYAAVLDTDEPPLLRSFLRVDVAGAGSDLEVRIRCLGVSGWLDDEFDPAVEDDVLWTRSGGWRSG